MNHRNIYHYNPKLKKRARQRKIEWGGGIQFLRFNDMDVKKNMTGVLSVIEQSIEDTPLTPLKRGIEAKS